MSDFAEVLDALDVAVAHAGTVLDEDELVVPAAAAGQLRRRRGFLGATLVMAFAGGTGVGKSSLLNAIAGEQVSSVSVLRPHTDEVLAWVPADAEPGFAGLLDRYGIRRRVTQDRYPGLAVIDLPDYDSVVSSHRAAVAKLVPDVDTVAWLVDPEKYRDDTLFREYLAPLLAYQDQFVFILNQIDRLGDQVADVVTDLSTRLRAAGFVDPEIFTLAANPPGGAPFGLEPFEEFLTNRLDAKKLALRKMATDVHAIAARLAASAGMEGGASISFPERWQEQAQAVSALIASDPGHGAYNEALCRLEDFIAAVSVETGPGFGRRVREAISPDVITASLDAAIGAAADVPVPQERGRRARRRYEEKRREVIEAELDRGIAVPLRELLWSRATLGATLAGLGVELASAVRKAGL